MTALQWFLCFTVVLCVACSVSGFRRAARIPENSRYEAGWQNTRYQAWFFAVLAWISTLVLILVHGGKP